MTADCEDFADSGQSLHLQATHLRKNFVKNWQNKAAKVNFLPKWKKISKTKFFYLDDPPPQSASDEQLQPSSAKHGPGGS